ncbi:MAG: ComF family protein [Clostridia bacterium]|nr:ComF family protein [Clostridia bacterium]
MVKKLIFPPRCPFCGRVEKNSRPCEKCLKSAKELSDAVCPKCGSFPEFCKCTSRSFSFKRNVSAFAYEGGPRLALLRFKERNAPQLSEFMANRMYHHIVGRYKTSFDAITYVPQTRLKSLRRGYCPAEILAGQLADRLHLPLIQPLMRVGNRQQKYLSAAGRYKNAGRNYALCKNISLRGKVLLIDDLFTTGATLDACASLLKKAGASEVCTATFCIAVKKS